MRSIERDLEAQRSALSNSIKSTGATRDADHHREVVKDPFGTASLTHDVEVAFAVADRRARQLQDVTRALHDIHAGRYGVCRDCGEPIADARLNAIPWTRVCIRCKEKQQS